MRTSKRIWVIVLLAITGLSFTGVEEALAGNAYSDGRAYLRQGSPQNAGKVYVSTSSSTPAASAYKTCNTVQTSESTTPCATAQVEGENKKTTYHFWAQANTGYKFTGWYTSTGTLATTDVHYSGSVTSGTAGGSDTHAYLDMHASFIKIIQMSFVRPENGSFTINHNGSEVANYASFTLDGTVRLTALPADGYKLRGWYTTTNGGATKSYFAFGTTCEPNFTSNVTIGADFVPDDGKATFWNQNTNKIYTNLNTANTEALSGHVIVVVSDGVLGAGTYTIKSGVTLLIPYNETYNLMTTPKVQHYGSASSAPALSAFRKLTLAAGAVINCSGNICIGGQQTAVNGGNPTSQVCGAAGVLDLSRGGIINMNSGSNLYAWGFVKGQDMDQGNNTSASGVGEINANNGATIWEDFQCGEWRGGTASSTIYSNKGSWKFFPFQSYTIQNIEAPVNYVYGSNLKCHWAVFGNGSTFTVTFPLVASSGSLFTLASGATLRKWYDPTTDRVCYELGGGTSLGALNLNVLGESISSSDYNLPIPANMHIILKSGNTLTISKPMTAHAGAVVEVKSGATLKINAKVYMYDADDWDTYCMYAYYYRTYKNLTTHYDRGTGTSKANLEDATLIVDGTVNVGAQMLYATAHGASIIGNGGGTFIYNTLPSNTTMVQCKVLSDRVNVNIRSANLKNDNESFTKGIESTTFKNINGRWFTNAASTIKSNKTYDFTYIKSGDVYGTGGTNTTVSACYSKDKTGLALCDKWANVKADACDNWWVGIDDGHLYNYTLNNAWHQYIKTGSVTTGTGEDAVTTDSYAGSDDKTYNRQDCDITQDGTIDGNCLYTIGGVKKALVNGSFIAVEKNTADEAYHKVGATTTYYICFDGCVWHPATKVSGKEKAYTVDGTIYIWYDGAWLAVQNDATVGLYYSLSSTNVKIYYEYAGSAWTLATPVAEVVTSAGTEQVYALATAITKAKAGGTNVTIRLLKNMTISSAFTYDGANNCSLDLNGYTLTGTITSMIKINNASATLIIKDQSGAGTGKVYANFSRSDDHIYGINVTKGHLIINSGTVHIENTHASKGAVGVIVYSGYKCTVNGGMIEVVSKGASYGVSTQSSTTPVVNINGGTIDVTSTGTVDKLVSGIYSQGGTINVNGGTINAHSTSSKYVYAINLTNGNSTLTTTGGTIKASAASIDYGVYVTAGSTATINGGTITATTTSGTPRGVISYGTTTISGGTITATAGSSDARGVFVANNGTTINNGAVITANANSDARALYYGNTTPTVTVNGGTFTAQTLSTTGAYGVYAEKGTGTINDGTFNVTAKTSNAYGMYVTTTNTPKLTVNGGKFKVASNAASPTNILLCNNAAATADFIINGGYYNLAKNENVTTGTEDGYTTYPNLSIAKYKASGKLVKELDATVEASLKTEGYGCKVAGKEYIVTWCKMGGNTGSNILKTEKWESGKVPVWTGPDPDLNSTGVTRVFAGWNTGTWNGGTAYPLGTPLPAITDHDVTYYAINRPIYAEVIAGGKTTPYTDINTAFNAAMAYTNATIRVRTQLGTEASISNGRQLVFNPENANSIITLDLNGLSWTMGNNADATLNKNIYLSVAPTKANCKLIITDNSASGNGYLMNKHAYNGTLYCVDVANGGELILQGGGLRASNTSDVSAAKYGAAVNVANGGKFTMTGGTVYSTDAYSPRGVNVSVGGTADIAGGTIEAVSTGGNAYGLLPYGTVSVGGTAHIKATAATSLAYATQTQGTLTVNGGTFEAKAASGTRGLFAHAGGKITVDGNPIVKTEVTSGSEAYAAYSNGANSELVINGGSFTSTGISTSGSIMGVRAVSDGVVTVNDGTFTLNGGNNWTFGAFAQSGTINLNGGEFTINQPSGSNVEAVRVYPTGVCNISGGTYTVTRDGAGNALCSMGGTTNITGNPVFNAYYGINVGGAVVAAGDLTATVVVDGGTYNTQSWGVQSIITSRNEATLTGSITGDVTIWDGKFKAQKTGYFVLGNTSPTECLKIRGGWYSNNSNGKLATGSGNYVVSPSTVQTLTSGAEFDAGYKYHVLAKYNVTFLVNGSSTVTQYNRNETPDFGSTPAINDGNTWEFVGWSPEIAPVTTDVTYTAVFKKYEAEIIRLGASSGKKYEHFTDAWTDALKLENCTIRILSNTDVATQLQYNPAPPAGTTETDEEYFTNATTTLDLNNHTLAYTGTADRFLIVNKAGSVLTVTDNSTAKGGKLDFTKSYNGNLLCTVVQNGELVLEGGQISAQNTYDGKASRAVMPLANAVFTVNGGKVQAKAKTDARAINNDGNATVNITGGTIYASTEYATDTWGASAFGVVMWNTGTTNISGNPTITVEAASSATGVYAYGTTGKINIDGGTINATTKTAGSARCVQSANNGTVVINDGTFTARTATTAAFGAYADTNGKMTINGGVFDAQNALGNTSEIWNIEGLRVAAGANVTVNGGTFTASKGASPMAVGVRGGTTTINGGTFNSTRGLYAMGYADATQTATVTINGGTFIGTAEAVRVESMSRDVKDGDGNITATYKAYSNVTVNGGYFYSTGSSIISLNQKSGVTNSTLVLNGGKYCEKSGTTYRDQIKARKGATTSDPIAINETVEGRKYVYELRTPFTVTWKGGTSYTQTETVQSGTTPTNNECTSFVKSDGKTYYFTGWTPTPAPVYGDVTYEAEGAYYEAEVKIGNGGWTKYADFNEAWEAVQNSSNATTQIKLLNNVELADKILYKPTVAKARTTFDLNNFTLSIGGTADRLMEFNKTDAILTITDGSEAKGGTLSITRTSAASIYTVVVSSGELKMTGGRIYAQNDQNDANWHPAIAVYVAGSDNAKLTMTGGTVESNAKYLAYGVQSYGITNITGGTIKATSPGLNNGSSAYAVGLYSVQRTTTFGGTAKIEVSGLKTSYGVMANGWISNDGKTIYNSTLNITGGTIDVTATNSNAVGIQVNATSKLVSETYYGAHGVINVSGGTINVKCSASSATQVFGAQVSASRQFDEATPHNMLLDEKGELNISGGTFTVDTRNNGAWVSNGGNVDMLRSWGTLNVTGGNFTIYQNSAPVGVSCYRNKATVSGNPVFNIYGNDRAYGVEAGPWNSEGYCDADAANNLAEIEVNGGTFNVNAKSGLTIGAWAYGGISANNATTGTGAGYAMNAKVTVNGGEFICYNPTANNSRIFRQENTRTGTYGTATAELIVNGGKFKPLAGAAEPYTSTGTHNVTLPDNNDKHTLLTGGYYVTNTELATHVADTCVVRALTEADAEYADGYRYAIGVNYVAQVKVGSTVKKYTLMKNAFDYFATVNNATLTVLDDCNFDMGDKFYNFIPAMANWVGKLDLNNHKITGITTTDRFFNCNSGNVKTFTITDSSAEKGGEFYYESAYSAGTTYGFLFYKGTYNLNAGTLHLKKTVAQGALAVRIGDGSYDAATPFNMTGGKIICEGGSSVTGIANYGSVNISGGEVNITSTASTWLNAITNYAHNSKASELTISGASTKIIAKAASGAQAINMSGLNTTTISGGTISATVSDKTARGILATAGTATISGSPEFTVTATTSGASGILINGSATIDISGTPEFKVTAGTSAYGIKSEATSTTTIAGGTFNVTTSGTGSWGLHVQNETNASVINVTGGTFNVQTTTPATSQTWYNIEGMRIYSGASSVMNISGGTFNVTNNCKGTSAATGVRTFDGTVNLSGTVTINANQCFRISDTYISNTTAYVNVSGGTFNSNSLGIYTNEKTSGENKNSSSFTITGGKFKSATANHIDTSSPASLLHIQGGFFNERSGTNSKTNLEKYVSDPYEVFTLEDGDANKAAGYAYEVCEKRVAKVKTGSTTTYYTTVLAAMNYARTVANPTITILHDCTLTARWNLSSAIDNWQGILDLNGKTVTGTGTTYGVIDVTKAGTKLTIRDSSAGQTGKLTHEEANNAHWGVNVNNNAELVLESGTIYVKNTKSDATSNTVGVCINSAGGKFTMSGGKIEVHSALSALGLYLFGSGTTNITGGKIKAATDLNPESLGNTARGILHAVAHTLTISTTDSIIATANSDAVGYYLNVASQTLTIGGTTKISANAANTAYGVRLEKASTINIGGNVVIDATAKAETSYAAYQTSGTITISESATLTAKADHNAYGVYATGSASTANVSGGTITAHVVTEGASLGVYAVSSAKANITGGTIYGKSDKASASNVSPVRTGQNATMTIDGGIFDGTGFQAVSIRGGTTTINGGTFTAKEGIRAMDWADANGIKGTLNINGGEFNATSVALHISSKSNSDPVRTGSAKVTVNGGKFKSTGTNMIQFDATPSGAAASSLQITGGYYNERSGTTFKDQIQTYCVAPKHAIELTAAEKTAIGSDYSYKVVDAYTLTWDVNGGNALTGTYTSGILEVGAPITKPADPTREGYTFNGWDTTPATVMPAANTTYTAQWSLNVAEVTINGTSTIYTTLAAAFAAANASKTYEPTIKILQDISDITTAISYTGTKNCTLNLNGHTVAGTVTKMLTINTAAKFTIDDSTADKLGKISLTANINDRAYGLYITKGEVNLKAGTIYSKNTHTYSDAAENENSAATAVFVTKSQKFIMDGGIVESESQHGSYAIYASQTGTTTITINDGLVKGHTNSSTTAAGIYTYAGGLTVNGGTIIGHAWTSTAYGVYVRGAATLNGGTIEATNDTISSKGSTTTIGIYARGTITIPSTSTVNVLAKSRTNKSYAVYAYSGSTGHTIAGGTFTAISKTGNTAYGIISTGDITVSGGTFNVSAATTTSTITTVPAGIYATRGTVTVNGNPTFKVTSGAARAYGVFAYGTIGDTGTDKYSGTININGGTFNVTSTTTTAYGAYAGLITKTVEEAEGNTAGTHYMPGIISITDGTFNVKATTTKAYGIVVAAAQSESGAVGTTTKYPTATITGGNFKVESGNDANATAYAMNNDATAEYLIVQGGKYSTKAISATVNIEGKYTAPKKSCNYYVFPLIGETPYNYEVAEGAVVTWNATQNGGTTGATTTVVKKGTALSTQLASMPEATRAGYTFKGWYTEATGGTAVTTATTVSESTTYYAQFGVNSYKITWKDEDGTVLKEEDVDYGETPAYGETPTKADSEDESYSFAGWSPAIAAVTGEQTYTSTYTGSERADYNDADGTLDFVDWALGSGKLASFTLNMNGYVASTPGTNWKVQVTGIDKAYLSGDRASDRTMEVDVASLNLAAGSQFVVKAYCGDKCDSRQHITVPYIYSAATTLSSQGSIAPTAMLYVKSGTLTVNGNIEVKDVVVNAGAELVIKSGKTLTVTGRIVLRTEAWRSAVLTNNGTLSFGSLATGKMYYSRIMRDKSETWQIGFPFDADVDVSKTNTLFSNGKSARLGTHFGLMYYDAQSRAENGKGANWIGCNPATFKTIKGKTGYQIVSTSAYYMEFLFPVSYSKVADGATIAVTAYSGSAAPIDQGWNYLVSPYTGRFTCEGDPSERIKLCELYDDNKNFHQFVPEQILPAMPFYYQATETGKLTFSSDIAFSKAPGRDAAARTQWLQVLYGDSRYVEDEATIFLHPEKFSDGMDSRYETGKLSTSGTRPFVWSTLPYGDMAIAALTDSMAERRIPLTVYAPAAGEMYFSLRANDWQDRLEALYLYDEQTGSVVDLLWADYTYDAAAGTVRDRFFLQPVFSSRKVTTGMAEDGSAESTLSIWRSGKTLWVAAEPGAEVYCFDAVGRLIGKGVAAAERLHFEVPADGVYLIQAGTEVRRVMIK
ncbi:MAG: InlB B-repeat-containing protein [Paludibacteraceae bacterium]|nr:InlB B-repeat-containing protein [Paludibacteraceae bacterium]